VCPGSPGRIPGLKGVTNFLTGALRIGVPPMGMGEENLDPEVFAMLKNESRATALGVKSYSLRYFGRCRSDSVEERCCML
jgi:hypothetical protein